MDDSGLTPRKINKSFSRIESMSKEGSITAGLSKNMFWKRNQTGYADGVQFTPDRFRSGSTTNSQDTGSRDSLSGESDSDTLGDVWQKGGKILFQSPTSAGHVQQYLMVNAETNIEEVARLIAKKWRLQIPKVVVSVISSVDNFVMPHESVVEDIQLGILQSARLTKMYVLTDGLNYGAARIIGEAVAQERIRLHLCNMEEEECDPSDGGFITAIGVVACEQLSYGAYIEESAAFLDEKKTLVLTNVGDEKRELNPHHSHSIIMNSAEKADREAIANIRFNLETRLAHLLYTQHKERKASRSESANTLSHIHHDQFTTPVVGLMLQGGPAEIERVLWLLKKQIPVVIINKNGSAAGLLAHAYREMMRGDGGRVEQILKPQLMSRVKEAFPEYCGDNELLRQQVRDKILECVKVAFQSYRQLLFVLDPNSQDEDLRDLNKLILTAILSAQTTDSEGLTRESINWTLRLALRWKRVDFAAKNIFNRNYISRFRVRDDLFVEALVLSDREQFVELFLDMGFLLQRLMTYEQVLRLFEASLSEEFFVTICLQNILLKKKAELGTKFMHEMNCELNRLLCTLSGLKGLVDPSHLLIPHSTNKVNSHILEKRALLTILYWAVLTNRKSLVKILWKRSDEPIAVALVISNMFYTMSKFYIKDIDLKAEIKQSAIEFGTLAIKIMDLTFNDSRLLAFHSLTNPIPEFNNLNVVDLALIGNNIFFIAHPCCQRSMRERWFGNIKIKSYGNLFFYVPQFLKIYLCLVLVFPMYFWLSFKPVRLTQIPGLDDDDERELYNKNYSNSLKGVPKRTVKSEVYSSPNIFMKIYYLWTAPITKFWVNQLFVIMYLFVYAFAVMLPYCGRPDINWFLCGWTMVLIFEKAIRNAQRRKKFPTMNMMWPLVEFLAELSTVVVLLTHLLGNIPDFVTYKLLLALCMMAVYFCALGDLLTASPELGPMLVNITELKRKDMINWLLLWMMWAISCGLAIKTAIYPAQPISLITLGNALLRVVLGIWLTEMDDLGGDPHCTSLYDTKEVSHTCNTKVMERLQDCPYGSGAAYVLIILYLLITRLVFYTLVFAMFSATINRTQIRSVELWKYQFQSIVTEFEARPIIPAPLNLITYPFRVSYFLGNVALEMIFENCPCCREAQGRMDQSTAIPYNQWKSYQAQISRQEEEKEEKVNDIIMAMEEESTTQQVGIKHLTDHLVHIERHQTMTAVYLEDLKKKLDLLDPKIRAQIHHGGVQEIHELSRVSPYPGTDVQRFPLLDKDVAWEIPYEVYDPSTYSKPLEDFPYEVQFFVDIDILSLPMVGGVYQTPVLAPHQPESETNTQDLSTRPNAIEIMYNSVQTLTLNSGEEVSVDRRSYMVDKNDQPLQYDVDSSGVPINPSGRTGLRGRGLLLRWGPNHMIKAVISRFKTGATTTTTTTTPSSAILQSSSSIKTAARTSSATLHPSASSSRDVTSPVLEILVRTNPESGAISLIGGPVRPDKTPYSTLCDLLTEIYPDAEANHGGDADQEEMIHTFSKFASHIHGKKNKTAYATYGYSAFLVYRGYEDSPVNTDNAWQEVEIFNFHYKHRDSFDSRSKEDDTVGWRSATDLAAFINPCDLTAIREAERLRIN